MRATRRAGFTLLEVTVAAALLSIVLVKLTIVVSEAQRSHRTEVGNMALDDRAHQVLDRIAYAVMGADRESLFPDNAAPLDQARLKYKISMGVEEGATIWSFETIGLTADENSVYWAQNEDTFDERRVVWCNTVSELLEDEFLNGEDDNGNTIADEKGLSFVLDGDSVIIRLTLERKGEEGEPVQVSVETTVTCRN
jgi:prepilin-type N-terminal cleavage/methylation domain-containing protein